MKRQRVARLLVWGVLALFGYCTPCFSQNTAVTATITDSDSIAWAGGTFQANFVPNPTFNGVYQFQGAAFSPQVYTGSMNGSGAMSVTIPDNAFISPSGTQWKFTLCSNTSAKCSAVTTVVTGASESFTTLFSSSVTAPRFAATGPGAFGYSTVEINQIPVPGGSFYNVTLNCVEIWNGSTFICTAPVAGFHVQDFPNTGSFTFTIPSGVTMLKVTVIGGGGAGGGGLSTATQAGSGGGSGSLSIKWLTSLTPGGTLAVTVGAGGTGVSGAGGNNGANSQVASGTQTITTILANGGGGGVTNAAGGGPGGSLGSGGDALFAGTEGLPGSGGGANANVGGTGASGFYGGGGPGGAGAASGQAGVNGGAGGGGGGSGTGSTTGGAGASGIVIFEWVD